MILPIALLALSSSRLAAVTFTGRAEPLSHLVVDLSKATGSKLTASKECANDVLLVSVQDVPVDKLLAEIAKIDAGDWERDGDAMRFTANTAARSNQPDFGKNDAIKYGRFKLGSRKLHLFTIHGSDRAFASGRLYDFHLYNDSPDFAMGELSSEWKSELTRRLTSIQQAQAQAASRKTSPPPH